MGTLAGAVIAKIYREYVRRAIEQLGERGEIKKDELRREFIEKILDEEMQVALRESVRAARIIVEEIMQAFRSIGYKIVEVDFALNTRGLVGTSSGMLATIFDIGLEIDPILGLPYYPASTLKGASRASCYQLLSYGTKDRSRACDLLFGKAGQYGVGHASLIVYSAAYPIGCKGGPCTIYVGDVLTPHYYNGGKPVKAEYNAMPVPIVHMSIADGTVFSTVVASRENIDKENSKQARLELEAWIRENKGKKEAAILEAALNTNAGQGLAMVGAVFLVSAIASGFAARSGKGYNVGIPIPKNEANNAYNNLKNSVQVLRIHTG